MDVSKMLTARRVRVKRVEENEHQKRGPSHRPLVPVWQQDRLG